jgi:hypothetical protein
MRSTHITFRGEPDVEIEYRLVEDDPSTNAFEVEWNFVTRAGDKFVENLTTEEDEAITRRVIEILSDPHYNDDDD